jgi:hypothetical protein
LNVILNMWPPSRSMQAKIEQKFSGFVSLGFKYVVLSISFLISKYLLQRIIRVSVNSIFRPVPWIIELLGFDLYYSLFTSNLLKYQQCPFQRISTDRFFNKANIIRFCNEKYTVKMFRIFVGKMWKFIYQVVSPSYYSMELYH